MKARQWTVRSLGCWVAMCLAVTIPRTSWAEPACAEGVSRQDRQAAQALFEQGNQQYEKPDFTAAEKLYREALTHRKHPGIMYNLARILLLREEWLEAHDLLSRAVAKGPGCLGNFEDAVEHKEMLENERLTELTVSCDEPCARVTVNGERWLAGPGSVTRWVLPGTYEVRGEKPGYQTRTDRLDLTSAGQRVAAPLGHLVTPDDTRRTRWWIPWSFVAAGAATGFAGLWMERSADDGFNSFDRQVRELCPTGCYQAALPDELLTLRNDARWRNSWSSRVMIVGGVVAAIGAGLWWFNRPRENFYQTHFPLQMSVTATAEATAVTVGGSW